VQPPIWLRALAWGIVGALVGTVGGWLLGFGIGRLIWIHCEELDCLQPLITALAGAIVLGVGLGLGAAIKVWRSLTTR
jgi:hypothetical protein